MYTQDGKNLIDYTLASNSLVSHIILGIDTFSIINDSTDISNRYHTPYIVDVIEVINSGLVRVTDHNEIVFNGQANTSLTYMANNSGIVQMKASGNTVRAYRTIINVGESNWSTPETIIGSPVWFNSDGGFQLTTASAITYTGNVDLSGYGSEDIVSVPVFFTTASPEGGTFKITFTFNHPDTGVPTTYYISDTVSLVSSKYKFGDGVDGAALSTISTPIPHVFQKKLGSGTSPTTFLRGLANITSIEFEWSGGTAGSKLYFGSPHIVPNFNADESRVTIAYKPFASVLRKTVGNAYANAEYRIIGVG